MLHSNDIQLENICRIRLEQPRQRRLRPPHVAVHELLDVRAGLSFKIQQEKVLVQALQLEVRHSPLACCQRSSVQHSDWRFLLRVYSAGGR